MILEFQSEYLLHTRSVHPSQTTNPQCFNSESFTVSDSLFLAKSYQFSPYESLRILQQNQHSTPSGVLRRIYLLRLQKSSNSSANTVLTFNLGFLVATQLFTSIKIRKLPEPSSTYVSLIDLKSPLSSFTYSSNHFFH